MTTANTIIKKRTLEWVILGILLLFFITVLVLVIFLNRCHKKQKTGCKDCQICSDYYDESNNKVQQCCPPGKSPLINKDQKTAQCV